MSAPPNFPAIAPSARLSERVADALSGEIRAGRLRPGDKLPTEPELAEQFSVSRTVVREAVSRLKSIGLVESRQGSGVYVLEASIPPLSFDASYAVSKEAVIQMVEVRRALEGEVAGLAAQRRTAADVQAIREAIVTLDQAVTSGGDGVLEDVAFHRAIANAARNPFLLSTLQYLSRFLHGATRVTRANEARRGDFARQVRDEHDAILAAIEDQDSAAARAAAFNHMNNAIRRIEEADPAFWRQEGAVLARVLMSDLGVEEPR
jgi:GntR family transcriptional repressor for pyruvate dehydrogenase complex